VPVVRMRSEARRGTLGAIASKTKPTSKPKTKGMKLAEALLLRADWVATMEVKKLQRQLDDLAKTLRELNGAIQETNWKVEIAG
jgi:hypothetical protein